MSKADKDEIIFDKKSSLNILLEEADEIENNENKFIDEEDDEEENEKYEIDTLNYIQNNILEYVKNSAMPLCEYITTDSITSFLDKIGA
jgi:hypothetical protein